MTHKKLKRILYYNYRTGVFVRKDRRNSQGSIDAYGYHIIKIKGNQYKAHRLAWLYHYGKWPDNNIDHINNNKLDNRVVNLRDVKQSQNAKYNRKCINPDTGHIGIHYDDSTKGLKAKITTRVNGTTYRFRDIEKAIKIRKQNGLKV